MPKVIPMSKLEIDDTRITYLRRLAVLEEFPNPNIYERALQDAAITAHKEVIALLDYVIPQDGINN